ncbi:unnamed protein product [Ectocarpus sp. 8 AP-2014]
MGRVLVLVRCSLELLRGSPQKAKHFRREPTYMLCREACRSGYTTTLSCIKHLRKCGKKQPSGNRMQPEGTKRTPRVQSRCA